MPKVFAAVLVGCVIGVMGWCFDGRVVWFLVGIICSLVVVGCNEANKASIRRHESMTQRALDKAWDEKGWGE